MEFAHIYNEYENTSEESKRREAFAASTWKVQYTKKLFPVPVSDADLPLIKFKKRKLPTLKSILDRAVQQNPLSLYFCFSNNDICFVEDEFTTIAEYYLKKRNPIRQAYTYSSRIPYGKLEKPMTVPVLIACDHRKLGYDVLFFHRLWWEGVRETFPDFVVAHSKWDNCIFYQVLTHGVSLAEKQRLNQGGMFDRLEYNSRNYSYTEAHHPGWIPTDGKITDCEQHNVKLFENFWKEEYKRIYPDEKITISKLHFV